MDDVVRDAARLIELARTPWDQQSSKVKSEISKLMTLRAGDYARALLAAHERIKAQAECIERLRKVARLAFHYWDDLDDDALHNALRELKDGDMGEPTNE